MSGSRIENVSSHKHIPVYCYKLGLSRQVDVLTFLNFLWTFIILSLSHNLQKGLKSPLFYFDFIKRDKLILTWASAACHAVESCVTFHGAWRNHVLLIPRNHMVRSSTTENLATLSLHQPLGQREDQEERWREVGEKLQTFWKCNTVYMTCILPAECLWP